MSSPTPSLESWLRLSLATLPTGPARELLRYFDGPETILAAALDDPQNLGEQFGLSEKAIQKLRACASRSVSKELEACEAHSIRVVTEAQFPPLLRQIRGDTPPFLFIRGEFLPCDQHSIGIVGTRQLTEYGRGLAHQFALQLAQNGITVVSGLARGIDTAAHRGALDGGGRTIAATACGLDIVYPSDNRDLMLEIEKNGAVLSEWCPGTPPSSWHFPARNRIIAGLSLGVLVVEAAAKSGALITANFAAEHDRTVFAIPGNVHKPQSRGPHLLIKEGAILVESVEDILEFLSGELSSIEDESETPLSSADTSTLTLPLESTSLTPRGAEPVASSPRPASPPKTNPAIQMATSEMVVSQTSSSKPVAPKMVVPKPVVPKLALSPDENAIWLALEWEPRHMDDIAQTANLAPGPANAALVLLELKGAAKRLPGNLFVKVAN